MSELPQQDIDSVARYGEFLSTKGVPLYRVNAEKYDPNQSYDFVVFEGGTQGNRFGIRFAEDKADYYKSGKQLGKSSGWGGVTLAYRKVATVGDRDIPGALYALKETPKTTNFLNAIEEARVLSKLEHPYIARVDNILADKNRNIYFLYELLRGETLAKLDKSLKLSSVHSLVYQMCSAVAAVHNSERIHNDVKPSNFVFAEEFDEGRDFRLKLVDFGLVTRRDKSGAWVRPKGGTAGYSEPDFPNYGPASDVFGLSASIAEQVFDNFNPRRGIPFGLGRYKLKRAFRHKKEEYQEELIDILIKGTSLRLADRYQGVPELYHDLNRVFRQMGSDFKGEELLTGR